MMRFRPDQVSKFAELYPDKPFCPAIRMLLDSFLDGKEPGAGKKRLDEVRRLRIKREKEAVMLKAEEERLASEEHQSIMGEVVEKAREQYIQEHPEYIKHFETGTISAKGYRMLQLKLKLSSRKQVEDWLRKKIDSETSEQGGTV